MLEDVPILELSVVQKRAFFKLAVDIVKADGQIHSNEVALLNRLQDMCGIVSADLDLVHYISLQHALGTLRMLQESTRKSLLQVLESIVGADNDIDARENILLSAIRLVLESKSAEWSHVISVPLADAEYSRNQIVYLERSYCDSAHSVLDNAHERLLIAKALSEAGFSLFYLPGIVEDLNNSRDGVESGETKLTLLQRSMEFIAPSGDHNKMVNIARILNTIDVATFYKIVLSNYCILPESIPFESFLFIKVQDGTLLNDDDRLTKCVDFLCIDMSAHLKERVAHFVNIIERPVRKLPYDGFYKMLYDFLSAESAIMSTVLLDVDYEFCLKDLDGLKVSFESAPQAKSLYLLLMRYGATGVSQECFNKALDFLDNFVSANRGYDVTSFKQMLLNDGTAHAKLIYNLLVIYDTLSTKDVTHLSFLGYISKIIRYRSSLKNYINKGFASVHHLACKDKYCIHFEPFSKSYMVPIGSSMFYVESVSGACHVPLSQSEMWNKMVI